MIGLAIITLVILLFAIFFTGINQPNKKVGDTLVKINSSNTTNTVGNFNETNKTSAGPFSIPLEKPPFID